MRNVSEKVVENIKIHVLCSITFFLPENRAVCDMMWKNGVQSGRSQMTVWRMRIACWIPKPADTHRIHKNYRFYTATMVAGTLLIVTLYVRWLSCRSPKRPAHSLITIPTVLSRILGHTIMFGKNMNEWTNERKEENFSNVQCLGLTDFRLQKLCSVLEVYIMQAFTWDKSILIEVAYVAFFCWK